MNKKPSRIVVGLLIVGCLFLGYKGIKAVAMMMGLWTGAPVPSHAKAAKDFGPYPFDFTMPQDTDAYWYDPAATVKRVQASNARPQSLRKEVLKASGGEIGKAMDSLMENRAHSDGAQALLEALRELAPQGSSLEGPKEGESPKAKIEPIFKMSGGQPGIRHVAGVLDRLLKIPEPDRARFDGMLMEDCVRLMGFHGAPAVPEDKKKPTVDGKGTMAPIDPVVQGILRVALASKDLQPFASRALGRLGDLETAKDLIENPKKYPSANISDFGPEAVEAFKKKRLDLLQKGRGGGEEAFWQGVRLSYRDRETAIDLARAGDSGAGLAMQRHLAFEGYVAKDRDERMARYIDIALRFPGTREAFVAQNAMNGATGPVWDLIYSDEGKKTREMVLRALDRDLALAFADEPHDREDLVINEFSTFLYFLHGVMEGSDLHFTRPWAIEFDKALQALYRKHRKKESKFTEKDLVAKLSLYGDHLGYPPIQFEHHFYLFKGILESEGTAQIRGGVSSCFKKGHIKSLERW